MANRGGFSFRPSKRHSNLGRYEEACAKMCLWSDFFSFRDYAYGIASRSRTNNRKEEKYIALLSRTVIFSRYREETRHISSVFGSDFRNFKLRLEIWTKSKRDS